MKNKKLLTLTAIAGLTLGGLSVATVASAQSYGDEADAPAADTAETDATVDVEAPLQGRTLRVQDTEDGDPGAVAPRGERPEGRRGHRGGCNLDDAAVAIGIDEAELRTAIDGGQTIAEVAEANGVDADTVIDAMVDAKAEHLAEKVEEGRITQDEADEKLAQAEDRITDRVNGVAGADEA